MTIFIDLAMIFDRFRGNLNQLLLPSFHFRESSEDDEVHSNERNKDDEVHSNESDPLLKTQEEQIQGKFLESKLSFTFVIK